MPAPATDADAPPGGVRVHASLPQRERRKPLATAISFLLHALVIYLAIRLTAVVTMPEHSPIGDVLQLVVGGGGGGGKSGSTFARPVIPPPPPVAPPVVPPPPPPPTVIPPPPPVQPAPPPAAVDANPASAVAVAGTGGGSGGGRGTGEGPGTGSGRGPGSGGGSGGGNGGGNRGSQPVNKQMILPPTDGVPKEIRGKEIEITFFVTAAGLVSDVKVKPPIANRAFAQKFDEIMRGYVFSPARDSLGNKIAGVAVFLIVLGGK